MLKFLLEKEFKQLLRGGMLPGILIMMPLMMNFWLTMYRSTTGARAMHDAAISRCHCVE